MSELVNTSDDSIKELFTTIAEFLKVLPNLENADSFDCFKHWFDELLVIDRRSLYIHMCNKYNSYEKEYIEYAEIRLTMTLQPKEIDRE